MLPIFHNAFHLFREDAYREYCWSVDVYGASQPASFIYLSFEAFRDAAARELLMITVPAISDSANKQKGFPTRMEREWVSHPSNHFYGLICRLENQKDVELVQTFLQRGDNVLALLPNEMIGIY